MRLALLATLKSQRRRLEVLRSSTTILSSRFSVRVGINPSFMLVSSGCFEQQRVFEGNSG